MKKLYYIADVLTLSRILAATGLIVCAILEKNSLYALIIFSIGELFDAADGTIARCARKIELKNNPNAPEPDRSFWVAMDQIMDILLGISILFYVWKCVSFSFLFVETIVLIGAPFAIVVQILREWDLHRNNTKNEKKLSPAIYMLVMMRRYAYVIVLAIMILVLITYSPLTKTVKVILIFIGIAIGMCLCVVKIDRLTQDKTPLTKTLNRMNLTNKKDRF